MGRRSYIFLLIAIAATALPLGLVQAHPIGSSGFRFLIYQDKGRAIFTIHTRDLSDWFPTAKNAADGNDVCKRIIADPAALLEVHFDGKTVSASDARSFVAEEGLIQVELTYPVQKMPAQIELWSKHLIHLPAGHQQLLLVEDMRARPAGLSGASVYEATLSREDDHITVDVPPPPLFVDSSTEATTTASPQAAISQPATKSIVSTKLAAPSSTFGITKAAVVAALVTFMLILILMPRRSRQE